MANSNMANSNMTNNNMTNNNMTNNNMANNKTLFHESANFFRHQMSAFLLLAIAISALDAILNYLFLLPKTEQLTEFLLSDQGKELINSVMQGQLNDIALNIDKELLSSIASQSINILLLISGLFLLCEGLFFISLFGIIKDVIDNGKTSFATFLNITYKMLPKAFLLLILILIIGTVILLPAARGMSIFFILAIICFYGMALAPVIMFTDNVSPFAAINRSFRFCFKNIKSVLPVVLFTFLAYLLISITISFSSGSNNTILTYFIHSFLFNMVLTFCYIYLYRCYAVFGQLSAQSQINM